MSFDLEKFCEHPIPLQMKFAGQSLNLFYWFDRLGDDWLKKLNEAERSGNLSSVRDCIEWVVDKWNLSIDDTPVEPTAETLSKAMPGGRPVPFPVLFRITRGITQDATSQLGE